MACVRLWSPGARTWRPRISWLGILAALSGAVLSAACVKDSTPDNLRASLYSPEHTTSVPTRGEPREGPSFASNTCAPPGAAQFILPGERRRASAEAARRGSALRYSPGDRLHVAVYGSPELSGDYVINPDGTMVLSFAGTIQGAGLTNAEVARRVEQAYVRAGLFTREGVKLSVRPVQYAPVNVTVAGAVFYPGRHAIGGLKDSDKLDRVLARSGDNPMERFVPAALRAAGGVRPDANLSAIKVYRGAETFTLDWRGAVTGAPVDDMPLMDGDHVQVEESGCFQSALVRPSQITPPGIRITYSNLTSPAQSNAASIQSYQFAGSVPYGTRLLQGLAQANCIGGNFATNAHRHAVLISRNPRTQETEVIQRPVEVLVRSADRDVYNPFLMPDDVIVCYDSTTSEIRDVMSMVQTLITPASTVRGMVGSR